MRWLAGLIRKLAGPIRRPAGPIRWLAGSIKWQTGRIMRPVKQIRRPDNSLHTRHLSQVSSSQHLGLIHLSRYCVYDLVKVAAPGIAELMAMVSVVGLVLVSTTWHYVFYTQFMMPHLMAENAVIIIFNIFRKLYVTV